VIKIYRNVVIIRGKQERREESQSTTQEFQKVVSLPEGQKPEDLECTISKGILRITSSTQTRTVSKSSKETVTSQPETRQSQTGTMVTRVESGPVQTAENFEVILTGCSNKLTLARRKLQFYNTT